MHVSIIARVLMLAALTISVVACGGAPAATQRASQPAASQPAASAAAPTAAAQTPAPPAPGGGISIQDPCGLATVEEVSAALGSDVVTAEANTTDTTTTYCNYESEDGTVGMAVSFSRGMTFVFDSYAAGEGAIPVPGIGDGAVVTSQGVMFIKSGDALVGIQPLTEFDSPEEMISALAALAQAVASRL